MDLSFKIQESKKAEWKKAVGNNCMDSYSFGVIEATTAAFRVLDADGSPEDAEKSWKGMDLTGYMAGAAAQMIGHFHVRGDEFRKYWNSKFGVDEEKAKGGTVNPALMTFPG